MPERAAEATGLAARTGPMTARPESALRFGPAMAWLLPLAFRLVRRAPLPDALRRRALTTLYEVNQIYDRSGPWRRFVEGLEAAHLAVGPALDHEAKRRLFKASVRLVEFEPHSYCNRKCTFCPNVVLDRLSERRPMNMVTYRRAIDELATIGYDGVVRFARYCEPLACANICEYVAVARRALPAAEIDIVSNGDFATAELLDRLADAGLTVLRISVYPKGYVWDVEQACVQMKKICANMGLKAELVLSEPRALHWRIPHPRLVIHARAADLANDGYDRGQSLANLIDRTYVRTTPCPFVFGTVTVDFDGAVMPCCNLRGDAPEHKGFIADRLDGTRSLFDVYASGTLTGWRRSLVRVDRKAAPCSTCKHRALRSALARAFLKAEVDDKLRRIGRAAEPAAVLRRDQ